MIDKRLLEFQGIRLCLGLCAAFTLLRALCMVGQAYSLAHSIVELWQGAAFSSQYGYLALFLTCFLLRQLSTQAISYISFNFALKTKQRLRQQLLDVLFTQGASYSAAQGSAQCVQIFVEQAAQIQRYLELMISKFLGILIVPLVLLVGMITHDLTSGIIALTAFPFIMLYMVILGKSAQEEADRQYVSYQALSQHFFDSVRGMRVLQLAGKSWSYAQKIYEASEKFREMSLRIIKIATLSSTVLDLFATGALAAVSIMLGFRLVNGSLDFFPALLVLMLVPEYFLPVREFAADYHATLDGKTALAAYDKALAMPVVALDKAAETQLESALKGQPLLSIKLKGVVKSYGEAQVLSHLEAEFSGAKKIGIIGASGSGKSTLLQLIAGLDYADEGKFYLQEVELEHLSYPVYQQYIAYIPQSPHIFKKTLAENLSFYRGNASEEELIQLLQDMGLSSLLDNLPQGLQTVLGDGGQELSGGQAQRIALARACLDPRKQLIILDEPSAQLDIETEYELKESLLKLMEGKLVIFATHRLHWLEYMDEVYELKEGKLERIA